MAASWSILVWVKIFMFPIVPQQWGNAFFHHFTLLIFFLHSFWNFLPLKILLTHTKDQLSGENKSYHSLLFVFPTSTFAPVFLPSVLSIEPVKWLQWYSWVLVMKWRFHSRAARRSLGWTAGQVKLWQESSRTMHTFSMFIFPFGLWIFCSLNPW